MRLKRLQLFGFKSFADRTTFDFGQQTLTGVVGPNGCGKSNIMDAVRWVLGESRASELRGESMQDVIFNGTNNRKPASRSSVELVFDNADHRAGGQWGQFGEIAVKRVLTRDGLLNAAWDTAYDGTDRTIDTHVKRIRKKFEEFGLDPIETVYGLGYRLRTDP